MKSNFEWYWFIFHFIQIGIFQLYAAQRLSNLSFTLVKKRNPRVASEVLGDTKELHSKVWDIAIYIMSISLLIIGFFSVNKKIYWLGKYLSLYGFLFTVLVIDLWKYNKLVKKIPLLPKREASLVTRKLGRIIPLWGWGLYLVACSFLIYSKEELKARIAISVAAVVFLAGGVITEKRSKLPIKTDDDELYRKSEAWTCFIVAWSLPLISFAKENIGFYGMDALFSTIPLISFVVFLNSNIYKKIISS